ncbi:hypothetical protein EV665_121117, partial [Shinella granuli]
MSYARSTPDQSPPLSASRQKTLVMAIFLCAAFFFQLRFNVSPHVMNLFVTYTDTGGAIYEKLHFGSIGIFLLLPFAVASRPFVLRGSDIVLFRSALLFSCLMGSSSLCVVNRPLASHLLSAVMRTKSKWSPGPG